MKVEEVEDIINKAICDYKMERGKRPLLCVYAEMDFYQSMRAEVPNGWCSMVAYTFITESTICGVDVFPVLSKRGGKRPVPVHVAVIGESSQ